MKMKNDLSAMKRSMKTVVISLTAVFFLLITVSCAAEQDNSIADTDDSMVNRPPYCALSSSWEKSKII